ncbi:MAG: invasion associated locus B family protein [Pseudomonadota bacterium]
MSIGSVAAPLHGKTFSDWVIRCEKPVDDGVERPQSRDECFMAQNLVLRDGNQRVLLFAVAHSPGKGPVAIVTMPLGIALPPGITIQVDGGKTLQFEIERCVKDGCKAAFPLDDQMVRSFKRGLVAEVVIRDAARRPVAIPVSLKGFTAALKELGG